MCDDWIYFSKFKSWMEQQDWRGKELDKDLVVRGNKEYGPNACVFISKKVNSFLRVKQEDSEFPGVSWHKVKNKFAASCRNLVGKQIHLGYFDSSLTAHKAWLEFKQKLAYELADLQTNPVVATALREYFK